MTREAADGLGRRAPRQGRCVEGERTH
jgi:hypothetical protein